MGNSSIIYHDNGVIESERWHVNGKFHRTDGPAWVHYHYNGVTCTKRWYKHNILHRLDGPAEACYYDDGSVRSEIWMINGVELNINEFLKEIDMTEMNEEAIVLFGLKYG